MINTVFTRSQRGVNGFQKIEKILKAHASAEVLKSKSVLLPGHLTSYLLNFSTNFWVYHYFHVFKDFRKLNSIWNYVFWCHWHPRTSWEWSLMKLENFIFFMKILILGPFKKWQDHNWAARFCNQIPSGFFSKYHMNLC